MKPTILRAAILAASIILTSSAAIAEDQGPFQTAIVRSGDAPFQITLKERRFIRILNFVQDVQVAGAVSGNIDLGGGIATTPAMPAGDLRISKDSRTSVAVITASFASQSETQRDLVLSGPATITVSSVPNANLVLTYRTGKD